MEIEAIPKSIALAINNVMLDIKSPLKKDKKNKFQDFDYTSIDGFLEQVHPTCAKHGLIIVQHEKKCALSDDKKTLMVTYDFILCHKDGDTWSHGIQKHIAVPYSAATALGIAQSYTLKQFMRSLFQIATGEQDELDKLDQRKPENKPKEVNFDD
jgi:hypothetical protein|tara:strand:+ start:1609 stop:2073 length:465 start_codon:yes stop_codon:yes gene_type:complete